MNTPFTKLRKTVAERFGDADIQKTITKCMNAAENRKLDVGEVKRMIMLSTGVNALCLKYILFLLDHEKDLSIPEVLKLATTARGVTRSLTESINAATKMLMVSPEPVEKEVPKNLPPDFNELVDESKNQLEEAAKKLG